MARSLKLGLIQMDCRLKDKKYNVEKAVAMAKEAAHKGAELVVLPELFNTGYHPLVIGKEWFDLAEDYNGPTVQKMCELACSLGIYIVAPLAFQSELTGVIQNSSLLIDDQGQIIGKHDKIQLWATEALFFKAGREFKVFPTKWGKVGLLVCYDVLFPELVRKFALKGAELLVLSAAWRDIEEDIWDTVLPARALENTIFLAGINRVGVEEELKMFGKGTIVNPRGHVLKHGPANKEYILVHEIDLDDVSENRKELYYLKDIRMELYY